MSFKTVMLLLGAVFLFPGQGESFSLSPKLAELKWQCENICSASGGKSDFSPANKICKCLLEQSVDGIDIAVMDKNAKLLGMVMEVVENCKNRIAKRDVLNTTEPLKEPAPELTTELPTLTTPDADEEKKEENSDAIVGQKPPSLHKKLHHLVAQKRHREDKPMTVDQQKSIMQKMRDHLNRLGQTTDQKTRQTELEGIREKLRQLSQTVVVQPPQIRSRTSADKLKNIVQQAKLKLKLSSNDRLGAVQSSGQKQGQENDVEEAISEIFKKPKLRFDVITQDPSLIDD